jgi:hypothetical protein
MRTHRNGKPLTVLADGHPRRMADGKNAFRKMSREQREEFVIWMLDNGLEQTVAHQRIAREQLDTHLERQEENERNKRIALSAELAYAKFGTDPYRTPEQRQRENDIDREMEL